MWLVRTHARRWFVCALTADMASIGCCWILLVGQTAYCSDGCEVNRCLQQSNSFADPCLLQCDDSIHHVGYVRVQSCCVLCLLCVNQKKRFDCCREQPQQCMRRQRQSSKASLAHTCKTVRSASQLHRVQMVSWQAGFGASQRSSLQKQGRLYSTCDIEYMAEVMPEIPLLCMPTFHAGTESTNSLILLLA